ncbi:hypothetical protein BPULL_1655 [Bifidobacterium pullorum]|uniref:Uncharacterized protein n=1 Tax=Bifidobacterium pullorum TaxID=78448 RepID=A0A7V8HQR6_9BIFI|nr:hypothetical protein BPULL_1655 [Bifidobacterium pullorum]
MAADASRATVAIAMISVFVGIMPESMLRPVKMPISSTIAMVVPPWIAQTALMMAVAAVLRYPLFLRNCRFTNAGPTPAGMETAVKPEAACE